MQQIKFRSAHYNYDGSFNGFSYWGAIDRHNNVTNPSEGLASPTSRSGTERKYEEQFIIRKDKNDKEIYEGDIVKCNHEQGLSWVQNYTDIGVVEFSNGAFVLKCPKKGCENAKDIKKRYFFLHFNDRREFEVIGNIHEKETQHSGTTSTPHQEEE